MLEEQHRNDFCTTKQKLGKIAGSKSQNCYFLIESEVLHADNRVLAPVHMGRLEVDRKQRCLVCSETVPRLLWQERADLAQISIDEVAEKKLRLDFECCEPTDSHM